MCADNSLKVFSCHLLPIVVSYSVIILPVNNSLIFKVSVNSVTETY